MLWPSSGIPSANAFLRALVEHAAGDTGFGFSSDDTLTYADMLRLQDKLQSENLKIPGLEGGADYDRTVSQQEVAAALLQYAGMTEAQLGEYPRDYNFMADSVGLIDGLDFNPEAACTGGMFMTMLDNVGVLYDALRAEKKEPLFVDGVAQPIFDFDSASRYCVYVESNYDTDGDGELDLIKALVQLPSEVVEDGTQIATIFEARPYVTGTLNKVDDTYGTEGYDIDSLYAQPEPRVPGEVISTAEAIAKTDKSDYYYETPYDSDPTAYEDLNWYDYYLVRGFAVVSCGGPGTKGSGGFETCGTDLEIDAFKCVIEWLTGDRVAYASPDGDQTVVADWSNGNVGMTGKSYGGTTQFGLATTGVKGLKTIVPVAGIASWYEYTNSQGIYTRGTANYVDTLAWYCNGRYYDPEDYATIKENFENYLNQLKNDQLALNGDYGEPWEVRDYTLDWENIQCPALIVHGLNDLNVRTKQFDLMYQAYQKAGVDVKLLLHQSNHIVPTYPGHKTEMYIDDILYDELLNKWFSHYLYGVENGIEDMAEVTVQSNVDGSWDYYDSWETDNSTMLDCSDYAEAEETTISSNLEENGITTGGNGNWESEFAKGPTGSSAFYATEVTEDMTIQGAVEVHIKASTDAQGDPIAMSAMLVDIGPEDFKAYTQSSLSHDTVLVEGGAWMGGGLDNFDLVELTQEEVPYKVIANGWLDMCNPKAGYDSVSASADQKIQVENGKFYDYVMYLQPTLYTVQEGHTLALVIFTYDPSQISISAEDAYTITIDNSETYAIGMRADAIDLKYARQVAEHIGSNHHEIYMTEQDVLDALETVVYTLGTYDITTIRASMGMYLLCKAIHEQSDIRVLLTGEISDELFGYKYTDFAPSPAAFQAESEKRIRELHMYDVLRADRCISANSLEARVPFGDLEFVQYVMSIDPAKKMNVYGKGKYLLRRAFAGDYLPQSILQREKAAFSDAVGHSMVDDLKAYAETVYGDDWRQRAERYAYHAKPFTKESLLYREIFEKYYPGQAEMVVDFWMPNRSWEGCDVDDPSARVLSNYGASGQ